MSNSNRVRNRPTWHHGKWRIRWTDEHGKRRSETYEDRGLAQLMLDRHLLQVMEIKAGLKTGIIPDRTFAQLCDLWIKDYAPTKRSEKDVVSVINRHLRPAFGSMRLRQISSRHAQHFLASHANLAKKTVANHLIQLRAMLREAKEIGWLADVPKIRVPRCRRDETDYSYLRTDAEIRRFLAAAREEGEAIWMLYKVALFTGARAGELAALQPGDVDFKNGLITIQRSFDGPTKGGDVRRVPIFDVVRADLKKWILKVQKLPVLFPNERGRMHAPSARVFQEILHRVLDRAGFPKVNRNGRARSYVVFHDLRHSFASHFVMRGGDIYMLQRLLGHKSIEMTMKYAHLAPQAFAGERGRFGNAPKARGDLITLPSARGRDRKRESVPARRCSRTSQRTASSDKQTA